MNMALVIRQRLEQLELDQRDLAAAAQVTESYISQLLPCKKLPPAPERTDIYEKMADFLKLPQAELVKLADLQRKEELKKRIVNPPVPLFKGVRDLILRKCVPNKKKEIAAIFEKQPFGELERLVTQKLLDVAKKIAREELGSEEWLRLIAHHSHRSYEEMRVTVLEFLEIDVLSVSVENCVAFLDPMIEAWDIDLGTFAMEIVLNRRVVPQEPKRFEFVETEPEQTHNDNPGLRQFLLDRALSGDATEEEIDFLKKLRMNGRKPTPLYYYRELQNLRDPLHFSRP